MTHASHTAKLEFDRLRLSHAKLVAEQVEARNGQEQAIVNWFKNQYPGCDYRTVINNQLNLRR